MVHSEGAGPGGGRRIINVVDTRFAQDSGARALICSGTGLSEDGHIVSVGDEALVDALATAMRRRFAGVTIRRTLHANSAPHVRLASDRVPVRPIGRLARAIRASDVVVLGGGTMVQSDAQLPWWQPVGGLLRFDLVIMMLARLAGKPVVLICTGAEGLSSRRDRLSARILCRGVASVSARDEASAQLLRDVSGVDVEVAADAMFLPGFAPRPRSSTPAGDSICISLRRDAPARLLRGLASWLDRPDVIERPVVLVPMDRRYDSDASALGDLQRLLTRPDRCRMVSAAADWEAVYREIASAGVCVGMRLHFAIFAALAARPTVMLSSFPKTLAFAHDLALSVVPLDAPSDALAQALDRAAAPQADRVEALISRAEGALRQLDPHLCVAV